VFFFIHAINILATIDLKDNGPQIFPESQNSGRQTSDTKFHTDGPQMVGGITGDCSEVEVHPTVLGNLLNTTIKIHTRSMKQSPS
jgi:hypothetical protein